MEPNKILSASFLDLVFDDRNKTYGAYELRVTYPQRIKKSLLFVFAIGALAFTGVALANKVKPDGPVDWKSKEVTLTDIPDEPEKLPEPVKKVDPPPQERTEQYTPPVITPDDKVDEPPPTQDDLANAVVDTKKQDGVDPNDIVSPVENLDGDKKIIEPQALNTEPMGIVEIDAKFQGWEKFLLRNLNAEIPIDNGAPEGKYTVLMQFVVDLDGSVSGVTALTNHGFGMEQEAMRVIKKATKWEPAFQNGHHVKAYRRQPITFIVEGQ